MVSFDEAVRILNTGLELGLAAPVGDGAISGSSCTGGRVGSLRLEILYCSGLSSSASTTEIAGGALTSNSKLITSALLASIELAGGSSLSENLRTGGVRVRLANGLPMGFGVLRSGKEFGETSGIELGAALMRSDDCGTYFYF